MDYVKIPAILNKMNEIFESNGFEAYLVGGAVRDMLMKKEPHDWDVTTNAKPEQVIAIFRKVIPTGIAHGTVTVHFMGKEIEVTTFRTESDYSDGRHPDKIEFTGKIEEDLSRRDFTMNAIAASLKDGKIKDPFCGNRDILAKCIRTVGNPLERFSEDGLRPVRAVRFASQLGFKIEEKTMEALGNPEVLRKTASISTERFRDELMKLMTAEKPSEGLKLMESCGILKIFMPELLDGRNCIQSDDRGYHIFDVLDHNLYACDGAPKEKPLLRFAALLHDSGKPASRTEKNESGIMIVNFYNHEVYSEKIAEKIMTRLKFSNAQIEYVCHLIKQHMFHYEPVWSDSAVRRFLVKAGSEYIEDLFDLRLADMYGKYNENVRIHDSAACESLLEFKERIEQQKNANSALSLKDLAVNGKDLISIGIPAGKQLGMILNELFEAVLEDPAQNSREKLLEIAEKTYRQRIN